MHAYRTHTCGEICLEDVDQIVRLSGWIHRKREHANALFIDLRDHYGISQVVVYPTSNFYEDLKRCTSESVVTITGKLLRRDQDAINSEIPTGEVELRADEAIIETIKAKGNKCPVCWKINKVKCERHSD